MSRNERYILLALFVALLVLPQIAHADWENGMGVAVDRMLKKYNPRLMQVSCISLGLAFLNIFLLQRWITVVNIIILPVQLIHILFGFWMDAQAGWIAMGLFVATVGHLLLKRMFAK